MDRVHQLQPQERLTACISDVVARMHANRLKRRLNFFGAPPIDISVRFLDRIRVDTVKPASTVCDLGVYLDADTSMQMHVMHTTSRCFAVLRQLIVLYVIRCQGWFCSH